MVEVQIEKKTVVFRFEGSQKFLAMKRSLRIPSKNIESVSTETVNPPWIAGKIGTHLPPVFWAGTFWTRRGKIFYYVRDRSKCITLKLKNHNYSKVVVELEDKESTANDLRKIIEQEENA